MTRKKVIIACTRRRVSETIRIQLTELIGEYADVSLLVVSENSISGINCDLVVAISGEVAKWIAPFLMEGTEIIVLNLTIPRDTYDRLMGTEGESRAIVVNHTREFAMETVALLYALDVKNIELIPYYPGCAEDYSDITLAITPNELAIVPPYIKRIIDIGERRPDPLTLIEIFSRLDCLQSETIERIFAYGKNVISVNRGIAELTRNGHGSGLNLRQFLEGIPEAAFFLDEKKEIVLLNSMAQEFSGRSYTYTLQRNIYNLIPELEMVSRTKQDIEDVLLLRGGKKYLVTWRYFSKGALESSLLTIKNFERIRVLYAKYGGEKGGRSELKYSFSDIIGSSRAMEALKNKAARFANTDFPVLIQGESGTGKELLAQAVHQASQRKNGPFIAFNCAALADSLLESELFGYQEGAFTGASKKGRAGIFEMASGGTLFMDEIGDISLNLQAKILRVLQEQEVVRVGGSQVIPIDVRIISATNCNLQKLVEEKKFRLDLYYRLNTLILQTVPLRERPGDISDMLLHFFKKNRIKKNIHQDAIRFMEQYDWPGNVRELQNVVSYLSILEGENIHASDFPEYMMRNGKKSGDDPVAGVETETVILECLDWYRKEGKKIGRKGLAEKIKEYGVFLTEAELRQCLEQMKSAGLVEIYKGRGGTQISEGGREKLGRKKI